MKQLFVSVAAGLVLLLQGMAAASPLMQQNAEVLKQELAGFNLADPAADVRKNLALGDNRCMAVCGLACACIIKDVSGKIIHMQGRVQRVIKGTGDALESREHGSLVHQASEYAGEYNAILLQQDAR